MSRPPSASCQALLRLCVDGGSLAPASPGCPASLRPGHPSPTFALFSLHRRKRSRSSPYHISARNYGILTDTTRRSAEPVGAGRRSRSQQLEATISPAEEEQKDHRRSSHASEDLNSSQTRSSSPPPPYSDSSSAQSPPYSPSPSTAEKEGTPTSVIKELMRSPDLFTPAFTPPRFRVVLCHGLYGYAVRGQVHYWATVLDILRECGADVLAVEVPSTGSIEERGRALHKSLEELCPGMDINLVAHSMGGLDSRYLITHLRDRSYRVHSLTSIATPHRGSPVMNWFSATLGLGTLTSGAVQAALASSKSSAKAKLIPALSLSFPLLAPTPPPPKIPRGFLPSFLNPFSLLSTIRGSLLQAVDSPAYYNLTTEYCTEQFNPSTPDVEGVRYFSVAARASSISVTLPLFYAQIVLDQTAKAGDAEPDGFAGEKYEGNDGMVSVSSAKHGEFLGVVDDCNHWQLRGEAGKSSTPSHTPSELHSPPPTGRGWTWPDVNDALTHYLETTKSFLSPSTPSPSPATATTATASPRPASPSKEEAAERTKLKEESWQIMETLTGIIPGIGGGDVKTEKKDEGNGGTGEGRREKEREKKEGKREPFELARFYRAIMLNLAKNGL